jgi:hypothetical protein
MTDRDRTFHRLMAATRKRKAEDRHAREAVAQDNLYPAFAALNRRVLRSERAHRPPEARFLRIGNPARRAAVARGFWKV